MKQQEHEEISKFAHRVLSVSERAYPESDALLQAARNNAALDAFLDGIRDDRIHFAVADKEYHSFFEAVQLAITLESNFSITNTDKLTCSMKVNAIAAVRTPAIKSPSLPVRHCYRCKNPGH
jgi:hypothetical protein